MELKQMEYILAIADCGSLSRAADRLFLTQSALSQQLSKLEKETGCTLFTRERNGLVPTPAGLRLIEGAGKILRLRDETLCGLAPFRNGQEDRIVVGAASGRSTALFGSIYHEFRKRFPDCEIRLQESSSYEAERALLQGKLDLVLTLLLPEETERGAAFSHACLGREKLILIVPREHPLVPEGYAAAGVSDCPFLDLSLFREERFVLPSGRTKLRHYIDAVFRKNGFVPRVAYEVLGTANICRSLRDGTLCTVISSGFLEKSDRIAWFSVEEEMTMEYAVCWHPGRPLTEAERYFIRLCQENTPREL